MYALNIYEPPQSLLLRTLGKSFKINLDISRFGQNFQSFKEVEQGK